MLRLALAFVRVWTTLYTSGMPPGLRETRRAEIESDLWESQHDRRPESDASVATQMLLRLLRGVPDDLLWRLELIDLRSRRRHTGLWLTAAASILVAFSLWVGPAMMPAELPQPPNLMIFIAAPPPPPSPPPPPPPPPGTGGTVEEPPLALPPPLG
jgi:hypothetical protein